ncbi:MAG: hypothetical protein NT007_04290 [Candidatus Kapabacteria bacterium]|nr:hypothetical protein [Candidatus Kapabacteria bacterium]
MKLISYSHVLGCIEGDFVYDVFLDSNINRNFIIYLGSLGKLIFSESMPKPYFTIISRGKFTLKGSQFNDTFRVLLSEVEDLIYIDQLRQFIQAFE